MTEVAWAPMTLTDTMRHLHARGASQGVIDAAGRIRRQRGAIEDLRSEGRPPIPWLQSRPSQLATFYALLGNWYCDREMLLDAYDIDYLGSDQ